MNRAALYFLVTSLFTMAKQMTLFSFKFHKSCEKDDRKSVENTVEGRNIQADRSGSDEQRQIPGKGNETTEDASAAACAPATQSIDTESCGRSTCGEKRQRPDGNYEKRRKRKFQKSWKQQYPWLEEKKEGDKEKVFCSLCTEFPNLADKESLFVSGGSESLRLDTIRSHNNSRGHSRCHEARVARLRGGANPMDRAIRNLNDDTKQKLVSLFNTAYFVAKQEMPFKLFPSLCTLQKINGLNLGETYMNDHAAADFIKSIATVQKKELGANLTAARFLSVLSDGGTDSSVTEEELVYVRYVKDGQPVNKFIGIQGLENAKATGIKSAVERAMDSTSPDWKEKTVSFGCDGANVMIGHTGGVAALLKAEIPWLVPIHCIAHNLELGVLDALKEENKLKDWKECLQGIYKHYQYSPKAWREMRDLGEVLNESVNKPVNLMGTRWSPHFYSAIKSLVKNYSTLHAHFHQSAASNTGSSTMQGRSRNVIHKLESFPHMAFLFMIFDLLDELRSLSLLFQRDSVTLTEVTVKLTSSVAYLRVLAEPGNNGDKLQAFLDDIDGNQYKGVELKQKDDQSVQQFENCKRHVLISVSEFISHRFDPFLQSEVISSASTVFDVSLWPQDREEMMLYGTEELQQFVQHFSVPLRNNNFDFDSVNREYRELKVFVNQTAPVNMRNKPGQLWPFIFTQHDELFHNILMVVEIYLCLALSTACCERGVSCMNRIKTDWRSSLEPQTLDMLMRISIDGPPLHLYDPIPAVAQWLSSGQRARRPTFSRNNNNTYKRGKQCCQDDGQADFSTGK